MEVWLTFIPYNSHTIADVKHLAEKLSRKIELTLPNAKSAAVTIILSGDQKNPSLLFIKRKRRRGDPWSGQIAFPGGRKKGFEENLLSTAIRETYEEVGIALSKDDFLGILGIFSPRNDPEMRVAAYVAYLEEMPRVKISKGEVEDYFWVRLADMPKHEKIRTLKTPRGPWRGVTYEFDKGLIWGMTARIVKKLLTLYREG